MTYKSHAETFLANIFSGNMTSALDACSDDVKFISTRPTPSNKVAAYGTYQGKDGAIKFFTIFGETLQAGDFTPKLSLPKQIMSQCMAHSNIPLVPQVVRSRAIGH